jgi:hypothetical protein
MTCQACQTYHQSRLMLRTEATSKKYRQVHPRNLFEWPEQSHDSLREPPAIERSFMTSLEVLRTIEEAWGILSTLPAGNRAPAQVRKNHP